MGKMFWGLELIKCIIIFLCSFQIVAFQKLEMNAVSLPAEVNVAHFCFSGVSICFLDVFVDCGN